MRASCPKLNETNLFALFIRKLWQNPQAKHIPRVFERKAPLLFHKGSAQAGAALLGRKTILSCLSAWAFVTQ
jgi:hypothetical protein